jgi:radical SAM-linked protein
MVDCFRRAFCAAGVPLAWSEGFHPHLRIAFGPPLPLGVMGGGELMDIITTAPIDPAKPGIEPWLPAGLSVVGGQRIDPRLPALSAAIVAGIYRFEPLLPIPAEELQAAVDTWSAAQSLPLTVERKGNQKTKDLKILISALRRITTADGEGLEATLASAPGNTCRPDEVITVLLPGRRVSDFLVTRAECILST